MKTDEKLNNKQPKSTDSPMGSCRPIEQNGRISGKIGEEPASGEVVATGTTPPHMPDYARRIIDNTGIAITECQCERCKSMCHQPCIGPPEDIIRIAEAGYADRLMPTEWWAGAAMGIVGGPVFMIAPRLEENGWCTFRRPDGLCELHDKGLKPLEGKLAHHSIRIDAIENNLAWQVARTWLPLQRQLFNAGPFKIHPAFEKVK